MPFAMFQFLNETLLVYTQRRLCTINIPKPFVHAVIEIKY